MATTSKSTKASSALSSKKNTMGAKKNAVDTSSKKHSSDASDTIRYSNTTYTPMTNKSRSSGESNWSSDRGFSRNQQKETPPKTDWGEFSRESQRIRAATERAVPAKLASTTTPVAPRKSTYNPAEEIIGLRPSQPRQPRTWLDENGWNPGAFVDAAGRGMGYFNSGKFFTDMAAGKGPKGGEIDAYVGGAVGNLPGMREVATGTRNAIGALGIADTTLRNAEGNLFNYGLNSIPETNAMFDDPYGTYVNSMASIQPESMPMSMVTPAQRAAYYNPTSGNTLPSPSYNPTSGNTLPKVATPIPPAQASIPKNSGFAPKVPTTNVVKAPATTGYRPPPPNSTAYANGGVPSAFTPMTPAQAGTPPKTNTPMVTTTTPGTVMGPNPKPGTVAPTATVGPITAASIKSPALKAQYDEVYGLPKNLEGIIKVPTYDQYAAQVAQREANRAARQALYQGRIEPIPEGITQNPNFIESYNYANAVHQQDDPQFARTIGEFADYVYNRPRSMDNGGWYLPAGEWPQGMSYEEAMYRWQQKWQAARQRQIEAAMRNR